MVELKRLGGVATCVLAAWTAAAAPVAFTDDDAQAAFDAAGDTFVVDYVRVFDAIR